MGGEGPSTGRVGDTRAEPIKSPEAWSPRASRIPPCHGRHDLDTVPLEALSG